MDPNAAGSEVYECEEARPPTGGPCSDDQQRVWVVENSAQARNLAEAINCSGGSFEVEWRGSVVVDKTILVVDGTVVNVTGADSSAVMDGNGSVRVLTVVNAALHLNSVGVSFGASVVGGAIALAGSRLTLNATNFVGNRATGSGGAVYVFGNSSVSCAGVSFEDNMAGIHGGAIFVMSRSTVSHSGKSIFTDNTAGNSGGAIGVHNGSRVLWTEEAVFTNNAAERYGGAVSAVHNSSVSWSAGVDFDSNSAVQGGGGVRVEDNSNASWSSSTTSVFVQNVARLGGAVFIELSSYVSFAGSTSFINNTASWRGGAVSVAESSNATWSNNTTFLNNVGGDGGALIVTAMSRAVFSGIARFDGNSAVGDPDTSAIPGHGGGLLIYYSDVAWVGQMSFVGNTAIVSGGAISALGLSALGPFTSVAGAGATIFSNNSAATGGAMYALSSTVSWSGDALLADNQAHNADFGVGGAICLIDSKLTWDGERTSFVGNVATVLGGALYITESDVFWGGTTEFVGGRANAGGALFVANGSSVGWSAPTEFTSNEAVTDGGAMLLLRGSDTADLALVINGSTTISLNTCGANGGALAMIGDMSFAIGTENVSFVENSAAVAGGAVTVSGTGIGPVFSNVSFISNSAPVGGAAYIVGSGNSRAEALFDAPDPTTFDGCQFLSNWAYRTGGAVDSAAGQDAFVNSYFANNTAGVGGALRLAGTAYVENCVFEDSVSDEEGGAAVSNIGNLVRMSGVSFIGNVFDCQQNKYLGFNAVRCFAQPRKSARSVWILLHLELAGNIFCNSVPFGSLRSRTEM